MALVDDLAADVPQQTLSRREALGKLTGGAFGFAVFGTVITSVRYLRPNVLFEPATRVKVGQPADIGVGTLLVLPAQRIYVVHAPAGFFALSSVCTHLGCMTRFLADQGRIACPCHGSGFDMEGHVIAGPAPRPLPRKLVTFENGELVVDLRQDVDPDFVLEVA